MITVLRSLLASALKNTYLTFNLDLQFSHEQTASTFKSFRHVICSKIKITTRMSLMCGSTKCLLMANFEHSLPENCKAILFGITSGRQSFSRSTIRTEIPAKGTF
jgi:hypothetical protein